MRRRPRRIVVGVSRRLRTCRRRADASVFWTESIRCAMWAANDGRLSATGSRGAKVAMADTKSALRSNPASGSGDLLAVWVWISTTHAIALRL